MSTCHWCHVMERESFEDPQVAAVLNRVFVCIKVDREERPDIDGVYMSVCQALTGSGGWPLTILMTPEKHPFFAGTYFPKRSAYGRMGLMELALQVEKRWRDSREELLQTAGRVMEYLQNVSKGSPGRMPGEEVLHEAFEQLKRRYDPKHGGFGSAPKFPAPHQLTFLLRYWKRTRCAEALEMVEHTLAEMSRGGIYDHLGFGFHRYSTDRQWRLPHFEKMLYDQALLSMAYLEAYQALGKEQFADTAREIFTYVIREMTSPEGGFYSAEDADSEGEEGKFYTWSAGEIEESLGLEEAALFMKAYNVRPEGNFSEEATGAPAKRNILYLTRSWPEIAEEAGLPEEELLRRLEGMKLKLFLAREQRLRPYKDDKILTDWNGLMIAALAVGGRVLEEEIYTEVSRKAAKFILSRLRSRGRLLKRYREGEAALPAHLDDYAFLVWGLLELYETTFEAGFLREALELNRTQRELFGDEERGGFFFAAAGEEELPVRQKELYDGAIPSGNSVAALNNIRLARITGNPDLEGAARGIAAAFSGEITRYPSAYTQMLAALDFMLGPSLEIVIAGKKEDERTQRMLSALRRPFLPNKVVLLHPPGEEGAEIEALAPFVRGQQPLGGKTAAYVCRDFSCQAPVTEVEDLLKLIE